MEAAKLIGALICSHRRTNQANMVDFLSRQGYW